jgi:hypothetical protein
MAAYHGLSKGGSLGAEPYRIGSVFDVSSGDPGAVVAQDCTTDSEVGVRTCTVGVLSLV